MVNYVNTVFVGNGQTALATSIPTTYAAANVGKFIIMNAETGAILSSAANMYPVEKIKIGEITATPAYVKGVKQHVIKWSNTIDRKYIKSNNSGSYVADTAEAVKLNFANANMTELSKGNMRVIVRLTNKDTETRYRKWTDSFEYVTAAGDDAAKIVKGLKAEIEKNYKRARVSVSTENSDKTLVLTALPYDDDDAVDTINWAKQVRFSANAYYTNPQAAGFASKNKYSINGLVITKTPGKVYQASAKLVRDRESWAMGYQGILNRGDGTWPIIKPGMMTDLSKTYDYYTIEFENMYRAADDIQRHTKQCVEIYEVHASTMVIKGILDAWVSGNEYTKAEADLTFSKKA